MQNQSDMALAYIKAIRNYGKHEYARAYWQCCTTPGTPSPDRTKYGISYMAAQAVRMRLEDFIK